MNEGFYSAASGVLNMQTAMDITANNIANVSTHGFKPMRASFSDLLYTVRNKEDKDVDMGHGVKIDKTDLMFDGGQLVPTGRELDFAVAGEGLFALQKAEGETVYSKDGAFYLMQQEGSWYLTDEKGSRVLDEYGSPIIAEYDENGVPDKSLIADSVAVYKFPNPYGLKPDGDNYFLQTESSGQAQVDEAAEKMQCYLEASSSNLADQMVKVIEYQRAFSLNIKMVQTADQIEQNVNNLR